MTEKPRYSNNQQKLLDRLESLRPHFLTEPWLWGYMPRPEYYHRLSLDWEKCQELANYGYNEVFNELGNHLYFTQALIAGCVLKREKRILSTILGTGLGKSYVFANINLIRAKRGEGITAFAPNRELNNVIYRELASAVSKSTTYKRLLFDSESKAEALNKGASQKRFAFPSGGFIDLTIAKNATGVHSSSYMDEYSLLTEDEATLAQGRAYAYVDPQGRAGTITKSSNPHLMNHSYLDMIKDPLTSDEAVIWGDWRLNVAEGKYLTSVFSLLDDDHRYLKSQIVFTDEERNYILDLVIEQIKNSPFFNHEDDLRILYLSEFGVNTKNAFFTTNPNIDDTPKNVAGSNYYNGFDVATRGKDQSIVFDLEVDPNKAYIRLVDYEDVKPERWVDHQSPIDMAENVINHMKSVNTQVCCMDATGVGEGQFNTMLLTNDSGVPVVPIRFGDGPTALRVKKHHKNAILPAKKRGELFLDFKELIDSDRLRVTSKVWEKLEPEMQAVMDLPQEENKKIKIDPKDAIKKRLGRSTDYLDSALLAVHAYILDLVTQQVTTDQETVEILNYANEVR